MRRFVPISCLLALILSVTGTSQAETVSLGYKAFTGPSPSVFFAPDTLERAESFEVLVTADPVQAVDYEHYISCTRGSETVAIKTSAGSVTPPYSVTVLPTLTKPDSCWITLSAETPIEGAETGTVRIEASGSRRPYWSYCSLPRWLKSGEARVHGSILCSQAKSVANAAWSKPTRAGSYVKVKGFACLRSRLRVAASIRCTRDATIIRIKGRIRASRAG